MKGVLSTYIRTYGGVRAPLFNPHVGLLIYICYAIVRPDLAQGLRRTGPAVQLGREQLVPETACPDTSTRDALLRGCALRPDRRHLNGNQRSQRCHLESLTHSREQSPV
jgi:hypothetical protein